MYHCKNALRIYSIIRTVIVTYFNLLQQYIAASFYI